MITGGNGSGKTTLITLLAKRGYHVVPEAARMLIDHAAKKGITSEMLRADEAKWQQAVMDLKIKLEHAADPAEITFFDRGMHDLLAYDRYYKRPEQEIAELLKQYTYKKVFILDALPTYEDDYARTEDEAFARDIARLQYEVYSEYGMDIVRVPVLETPEARADFVVSQLESDQDGIDR